MINIKELQKLYPPNFVGFDRGILREYLQYKILDIIFKHELGMKLVFLGGTAIRICYNSMRFSEDLDFDNFGLTKDEFIELSEVIKRELEYEGYQVEIRNIFKGAFHCYVKIPEILQFNNLTGAANEKILIQIDTVPHNFDYEVANHRLEKFEVFRNIRIVPVDVILSMKVAAIFGRKRMKGRDFYDVVFLLSLGDFNYDYLNFKLGIANKNDLRIKLLDAIKDLDMNAMLTDVSPFLIDKNDKDRVLLFREYIDQRLKS